MGLFVVGCWLFVDTASRNPRTAAACRCRARHDSLSKRKSIGHAPAHAAARVFPSVPNASVSSSQIRSGIFDDTHKFPDVNHMPPTRSNLDDTESAIAKNRSPGLQHP